MRYENIADAVNYTYALVLRASRPLCALIYLGADYLLQSDKQLGREATKEASASWLPYALIDQVLIAADTLMDAPANLAQLRAAINNRVKRMQKLSQNVS